MYFQVGSALSGLANSPMLLSDFPCASANFNLVLHCSTAAVLSIQTAGTFAWRTKWARVCVHLQLAGQSVLLAICTVPWCFSVWAYVLFGFLVSLVHLMTICALLDGRLWQPHVGSVFMIFIPWAVIRAWGKGGSGDTDCAPMAHNWYVGVCAAKGALAAGLCWVDHLALAVVQVLSLLRVLAVGAVKCFRRCRHCSYALAARGAAAAWALQPSKVQFSDVKLAAVMPVSRIGSFDSADGSEEDGPVEDCAGAATTAQRPGGWAAAAVAARGGAGSSDFSIFGEAAEASDAAPACLGQPGTAPLPALPPPLPPPFWAPPPEEERSTSQQERNMLQQQRSTDERSTFHTGITRTHSSEAPLFAPRLGPVSLADHVPGEDEERPTGCSFQRAGEDM